MPNGDQPVGGGGGGGLGPFELPPSLPDKPFVCDKPFIKDNPFLREADRLYNDLFEYMKCKNAWGWMAFLFAGIGATAFWLIGNLVGAVIGIATTIFATVAAAILDTLGKTRQEAAPELNKLIGSTMSELFGVEIKTDELPAGGDLAGNRERARQIGSKLIGVLESEFSPTGEISPEQGRDAANAFTGFTTQFTVTSAFVAVLGEILSGGQLESFRELGIELAENLGLGRLQRRGLSELVGTTVATPYEWFLNKKYRPTELSPKEAVRGQLTGEVTFDKMNETLARAGYSQDKFRVVSEQFYEHLSQEQLRLLKLFGLINEHDYRLFLLRAGFNEEAIDNIEKVDEIKEKRAVSLQIANSLRSDVVDGVITSDEYADVLGRLALSDAERAGFTSILGEFVNLPRRTLTLGQMRQAFLDATIDVGEFEAYLVRVGYRESDIQILVIDALLRSAKHEEAKKRTAERKKPKAG
jgi:hypothetical protein